VNRLVAVVAAALVAAIGQPALAAPGPSDAPEYWFDDWQIQSLWADGVRGQGIRIAEIDSGVNAQLPELRGRILRGHDFGAKGNGQVDRERDPFGHGTAMASIMVARPGPFDITGLAPGAKILPLAVPLKGTTTSDKPDRVPEAIRYAADHHADIISMSLGGRRRPGIDPQPCDNDEQSAIFYALRRGALVIASVGNTGPTRNAIEDPGVCLGVLSVGAADSSGTVASFSSRQPYLSLVAPGVRVPSLGRIPGQAFRGSGTSQATALTSATAALVWSAHPKLDARGVATRILATLDEHRRRPSRAYGYGLLDAERAVTADVPADAPNPVFDAVAPFMSRVDASTRRLAKPTHAGKGRLVSTGDYKVGSVPWLTDQIQLGIGLAVFGLSLLVVLITTRLDRRRQRRRLPVLAPAAGQPDVLPPAPAIAQVEAWRPRPGPVSGPPGSAAPRD
jgi:subtilisin family serine protease